MARAVVHTCISKSCRLATKDHALGDKTLFTGNSHPVLAKFR